MGVLNSVPSEEHHPTADPRFRGQLHSTMPTACVKKNPGSFCTRQNPSF